VLAVTLPPATGPSTLRYETRTGALARIDGYIAGAFDREHHEIVVPASARTRTLTLEVELHALPTNGLPPGPGLRWRWITAHANAAPRLDITIETAPQENALEAPPPDAVPLWGHGHLDVAWLWTYADARRKATRTFANAMGLFDRDPGFVFVQSQPQLYDFVAEQDPKFFSEVKARVAEGRFDADTAAMWVEPDCNIPSGESLLRQMLFAYRYCMEQFGIEPTIAWLPDTFGFARTLPSLLAHAGIPYFGTTKLQWNDTTRFAHPQFRWRGPDGSEVIAASIDRMEGDAGARRAGIARARREPLIVGYGDGGGGPTYAQARDAARTGAWQRPRVWFEQLAGRRGELPVHDDELYLEYHRGVFTTHHDVKAANAALERQLAHAEEQAAWCVAVRAPVEAQRRVRAALRDAWEIVLRNQFHDVLPGTSIAPVYVDARAEYARAGDLANLALTSARAMLPRAGRTRTPGLCAPAEREGAYEFDNGLIRARVLPTGAIVELAAAGGSNVVSRANLLVHYGDRPRKWEAWNLDASYRSRHRAARPQPPKLSERALEIPFLIGRSPATMRVALVEGEPFLRVELVVDWRERRRLLRVENWLSVETTEVTYGAPHGTVVRSALRDTPERQAKYEVPGQRFALVRDGRDAGMALFALDTYGWSARALERGGVALGHSLLRSTTWPDPHADAGEARLAWAFAPIAGAPLGAVERAWEAYAHPHHVRLFTTEDDGVLVVACKPAEDGDGTIVRVRECDGVARKVRMRCGGRMREAHPVDALERELAGSVTIEEECLVSQIPAFGLRSFRVKF
jgi:alpha-mannosidase